MYTLNRTGASLSVYIADSNVKARLKDAKIRRNTPHVSSYRPRLDRRRFPRNNSTRFDTSAIPKITKIQFFCFFLFPLPPFRRYRDLLSKRASRGRHVGCFFSFFFFICTVYPPTLEKLLKTIHRSAETRKLRTFTRNVIRAVTSKVHVFQQITNSLDIRAHVAH